MNNKKFKIITHNDLDGIGCAIVLKSILNKNFVYVKTVGYDTVNEEVVKALDEQEYSHIFITDISVNQFVADIIDRTSSNRVTLIDHHPGNDYLNKYSWARVVTIPKDMIVPDAPSGTSLFYEYLREKMNVRTNEALELLVEKIRIYDTWLWHDLYHDYSAKELNDYMGIIGIFDFMKEMVEKVKNNDSNLLSDTAKTVIKYKQKEIDSYVKMKNSTLVKKPMDNILIGFVFAENYISELGNRLLEMNPDLNVIIIADVGRGKISIRSLTGGRVDCSKIAKAWYGGGGHAPASGGTITDETIKEIRTLLFDKYID